MAEPMTLQIITPDASRIRGNLHLFIGNTRW